MKYRFQTRIKIKVIFILNLLDLNTIIEENSNLNFSKTINNYNSAKYNEVSKSILFDKEEIMKQIEEQSELVRNNLIFRN